MDRKNAIINYSQIIETIGAEIRTLKTEIDNGSADFSAVKDLISGVTFYVVDEQDFVKLKDINDKAIYIAVKFGNASTNFGGSVCPITLVILGTANKIKPAQMFMAAFCSRWSLQNFGNDGVSTQIWVTPQVSGNFNEVNDEFRTLFGITGTILIGQQIVKIGSIVYEYVDDNGHTQREPVDFLSWQGSFGNSLAPQPFGNTAGFAVSESNFSTNAFSISTYMLDSKLVEDCLAIKGFRKKIDNSHRKKSLLNGNSTLKLYIEYSNGFTNEPLEGSIDPDDPVLGTDTLCKFKVSSISEGQRIGDIPTITIGFSL